MLQALTFINGYLQAAYRRLESDERGQSTVEYLVIIVGGLVVAGIVVAAVLAAVNGKIPSIKL